mmetsp:Transcript_55190/g.118618  ORF Transcript_55190/g.118618 Transcript_55190/m.118618 type:complete len:250 (-) Transcript_55190:106-855(-)
MGRAHCAIGAGNHCHHRLGSATESFRGNGAREAATISQRWKDITRVASTQSATYAPTQWPACRRTSWPQMAVASTSLLVCPRVRNLPPTFVDKACTGTRQITQSVVPQVPQSTIRVGAYAGQCLLRCGSSMEVIRMMWCVSWKIGEVTPASTCLISCPPLLPLCREKHRFKYLEAEDPMVDTFRMLGQAGGQVEAWLEKRCPAMLYQIDSSTRSLFRRIPHLLHKAPKPTWTKRSSIGPALRASPCRMH